MLAALKFSNVTKPNGGPNGGDATARVRAKIVGAINEQKASVVAAQKRETFVVTRRVKGGTAERKFRPWYFKAIGMWFTTINYGSSPLQLPGGHSIEAGPTFDDLLKTYDAVIAAVEAGELDEILLKASGKRGKKKGQAAQTAPAAAPHGAQSAPAAPPKGAAVSGSARARNRG